MATSPTLQNGAELERRRIEAGLKRSELAGRAGLHRTYIRLLEIEERSAQPGTLKAIADALPKCQVRDLLRNPPPPPAKSRTVPRAPKARAVIEEAAA